MRTIQDNGTTIRIEEKAKHTPGPWHVDGDASAEPYQVIVRHDQTGARIAIAVDSHHPLLARDGQANARLIAAAPDLLQACRVALAEVTNHPDGHMSQFQFAYRALRAAIAKAGGTE